MSCRLASVWALLVISLTGPVVRAQNPFPADLIPKRDTLARLGMERLWLQVVPLNENERVLRISRSHEFFFAQTSRGHVHTFDAQTGQHIWTSSFGGDTPNAHAVSSNSYAVFGTSANLLCALDRSTGRPLWKIDLGAIPSCGTSCDEDIIMVGTMDGKVIGYGLREAQPKGPPRFLPTPKELWAWQTSGPIRTLPLPARRVAVIGSSDGRVYVSMIDERTPLYRIATGGPIADGLGTYGTRTLLIPSADHNLYAVDLLTSDVLWTYASGAPIGQAPLVAGEDVFMINGLGHLTLLDPTTGSPRWSISTRGGRFVTASPKKLYLRSENRDLYVIDRSSGRVLADPVATMQRAGLNLREYELSMLNRYDDRLYFGTKSGMLICLREIGAAQPSLLRDPKALPFGYIPPEGIKLNPPRPAAAETPADADAKPEDEKAKDEAAATDEKDKPAPEPDDSKDEKKADDPK